MPGGDEAAYASAIVVSGRRSQAVRAVPEPRASSAWTRRPASSSGATTEAAREPGATSPRRWRTTAMSTRRHRHGGGLVKLKASTDGVAAEQVYFDARPAQRHRRRGAGRRPPVRHDPQGLIVARVRDRQGEVAGRGDRRRRRCSTPTAGCTSTARTATWRWWRRRPKATARRAASRRRTSRTAATGREGLGLPGGRQRPALHPRPGHALVLRHQSRSRRQVIQTVRGITSTSFKSAFLKPAAQAQIEAFKTRSYRNSTAPTRAVNDCDERRRGARFHGKMKSEFP